MKIVNPPIEPHARSVTISCTNGGYNLKKEYKIPEGWEDSDFFRVIIIFFSSREFLRLHSSTRYTKYNEITTFSEWVADNHNPNKPLPATLIYPEYFNKIKERNIGGKTVKRTINSLHSPLKLQRSSLSSDRVWTEELAAIWARKPKFKFEAVTSNISGNETTGHEPMSLLYEGCGYSDATLIDSLRVTLCWYLSEAQRHRELLLQHPRIKDNLDRMLNDGMIISDVPLSHQLHNSIPNTCKDKEEYKRLCKAGRIPYGALIEGVLDLEEPILIERLFYSRPLLLNSIQKTLKADYTLDNMKDELNQWVIHDSVLRTSVSPKTKYNTHRIKPSMHAFNTLTYKDLITPNDAETLAMIFLLASDRIQKAGIYDLELDDFSFREGATVNNHSVKIDFNKGRSKIGHLSTPIYYGDSIIYDTYKHWHDIMRDAQKYINARGRTGKALSPESPSVLSGGRKILHGSLVGLGLLAVEGSHINRTCIDNSKETIPFLDLFKNVLTRNLKVSRQEAAYEAECKLARDGKRPKPNRTDYVKLKRKYLSVTSIAKSRVEKDDGKGGYAEATATAHSEMVKAEVYKDKSRTKVSRNNALSFAQDVGDAMVADAIKVRELLNQTRVLDLQAVKKELNLNKPSDDLNEVLEELDGSFPIGLFGEINANDKTLMVAAPITAALIHGYIKHIDDTLIETVSDYPARLQSILVHKEYLHQILDTFPPSVEKEGRQMAEEYQFPYPPLI